MHGRAGQGIELQSGLREESTRGKEAPGRARALSYRHACARLQARRQANDSCSRGEARRGELEARPGHLTDGGATTKQVDAGGAAHASVHWSGPGQLSRVSLGELRGSERASEERTGCWDVGCFGERIACGRKVGRDHVLPRQVNPSPAWACLVASSAAAGGGSRAGRSIYMRRDSHQIRLGRAGQGRAGQGPCWAFLPFS